MEKKKKWRINGVVVILAVAVVVFSLISIVNHILFRTYGLDLGLYTNVMFDYSHLRWNDCTFFEPTPRNFLSDHFDLYLVLLSPLIWVTGKYTLLIVQVVSVLWGALGVYRFVYSMWKGRGMTDRTVQGAGLAAMVSFLFFFGVWQAFGFDYHSNVVATMWIPWIFYWLRERRFKRYAIAVVLVCMAKENMALWLVFVLLALLWDYRKERRTLIWIGSGIAFCIVYLCVVTMLVMPLLNPEKVHFLGKFKYMGDSFGGVVGWIVTHPWATVRNLFVNFLDLPQGNGLKAEFYICMLLSGGLLCFFKTNWLLMVVPLVAQKMLADDIALWGVGSHYSVEFAPVLVCGVFAWVAGLRWNRLWWAAVVAMPLMCIAVTVYTCSSPKAWVQRENVRLFDKRHYRQEQFDCRYARQLLKKIPSDASVCASQCFTPHLAVRDSLYLYPMGLSYNPEYVLVDKNNVSTDTAGLHLMETDGTVFLFKTR